MKRTLLPAICFSLLCSLALPLKGAGQSEENLPTPLLNAAIPKRKLIVGVAVSPPFNIKNTDGSWTGISVELWRQIAEELGIAFEFQHLDSSSMRLQSQKGLLCVSRSIGSCLRKIHEPAWRDLLYQYLGIASE